MKIQELKTSEIDLLTELQPRGWTDIVQNFEYYTNSDFCFPIKLSINNKIVGIGSTIIHNNISWLAHIIVHPNHRNKGFGKLITQVLVDSLITKKCETIYLIATDLGAIVYDKLGFKTEIEYLFFKDLKNDNVWTKSNNISLLTEDLYKQVINMDKEITGEDRMCNIGGHLKGGYVYKKENVVEGFYLPELGEGLIMAKTSLAGIELMKLRLKTKQNAVFPADNFIATAFLSQNNYTVFKKAKRMRLGKKRAVSFSNIYNRIGGYMG